jgi:L-arabinose isomerase
MKAFGNLEVWFVTGSQNLYGEETLKQVAVDAQKVASSLDQSAKIPVKVVWKPTLKSPEEIYQLCLEANASKNCIGLVTWMHTFSPAKMWIAGLKSLQKPFAQLHTQANREIPWSEIDMDFMNLNQTAHGGREYGFIGARLRLDYKVIVGFWEDDDVLDELNIWIRAAAAWHDLQGAKVARFGDNMREVAVTEGDKVEAQIRFGYSVHGFGLGDLVKVVDTVSDADVDKLIAEYNDTYTMSSSLRPGGQHYAALRHGARAELGMRTFLKDGGFKAFTTTFEDLYGLDQLPGLASQRLMAEGYGFGAEGDWKTAMLVHSMKVMATGLKGGTSFMEDYTYHMVKSGMQVLGAHMLEVCPSIAAGKPALEVHPLSIGGKADPARLVFNVASGPALNATVIDMGNRFRMIVNAVDVITPPADLPKLPVARGVWVPRPNLKVGAAAWMLSGGAHHTGFSMALTPQYMEDFAGMAGVEYLLIDEKTEISTFKKELRWNEVYYHLAKGF